MMNRAIKILVILVLAIGITSCATSNQTTIPKSKAVKIAIIKYEMARNIILHKDYKNLAEAFSYLDSAKKVLKNDPRVYYMLAIAYQLRGNMKKYESYLKKTIEIDHNFFDAYNALGIYYFQTKQYKKAIKMFSSLINNPLYPNADVAFYNRALVYLSLGKVKKAEEDLRDAAVFSNYSNSIYLKTLINTEIANKQYLEALKDIDTLETHSGKTCFSTIRKALCLYKLNNKKEAIETLNQLKTETQKCQKEKTKLLREIKNDNNTNN